MAGVAARHAKSLGQLSVKGWSRTTQRRRSNLEEIFRIVATAVDVPRWVGGTLKL